MNYGRIRRGPMAADAFTQIRNALFRDSRLSFKDKGVFGLISTHRDGFGISAEAIAACSTDGVSAVKVALRNLERHGYLQRTQQRKPDGTLGASVYFITDQPEAFGDVPELDNPRSAPSVENPPADYPPAVEPPSVEPLAAEPPAENHLHKNTNSNKTSSKKTTSSRSRVPKPRPAAPAAKAEEEGSAATPEQQRARLFLMRLPAPWALGPADAARIAPQLADAVTRLGLDYDDHLAGQIATNDFNVQNHAAVIETRRIPNLRPAAPKVAVLPPACPACLAAHPAAELNKRLRARDGRRCPDCHPDAVPVAA